MDQWRRRDEIRELNRVSSYPLDQPAGLEELIELFQLQKMLRFFLNDHSMNAPRPPWIQPLHWETQCLPVSLSISETRGFLRALCRLQVLANIFGDSVEYLEDTDSNPQGDSKIWQLGETHESVHKQGGPDGMSIQETL